MRREETAIKWTRAMERATELARGRRSEFGGGGARALPAPVLHRIWVRELHQVDHFRPWRCGSKSRIVVGSLYVDSPLSSVACLSEGWALSRASLRVSSERSTIALTQGK